MPTVLTDVKIIQAWARGANVESDKCHRQTSTNMNKSVKYKITLWWAHEPIQSLPLEIYN
jgi:hypothetical protein